MNIKKYFFILILSFLVFVPSVYALDNSSFILDQIWYSNNSPKEGDTIKIYTAVWNGSPNSLSAKVEFYDKNVILGTRDIVVPSQKLLDTSVSWKVTSGDHAISAKIISSILSMPNGKKETITLKDNTTSTDKKFISVVVKEQDGISSTNNEIVKDELGKVTDKINEIVPESVSIKVSSGLNFMEDFRNKSLVKIIENKKQTEEKILEYKSFGDGTEEDNLESATEKPIEEVKLFFLKILNFIFNNKIIFYGLIVLFIFYILRKIYRIIRNR